MSTPSRIHIPLRAARVMVWNYAKSRVVDQLKSVSFILLYLVGFQILVLGSTPGHALRISGGIAMVVLGLAFFLEGLFLGLMPLGERVGVGLPRRCGIFPIVVFGLLLGIGSTFAEPAMASLRAAGDTVTSWGSPLLYSLLNQNSTALVLSVAGGVGVAVAFGMVRFTYGLSIKPFIFALIPLLLLLSGILRDGRESGIHSGTGLGRGRGHHRRGHGASGPGPGHRGLPGLRQTGGCRGRVRHHYARVHLSGARGPHFGPGAEFGHAAARSSRGIFLCGQSRKRPPPV